MGLLRKKGLRAPSPLPCEDSGKLAVYELGRSPHPTVLVPWSWTSSLQSHEHEVLAAYKPPSRVFCDNSWNGPRHFPRCCPWESVTFPFVSSL